MRQAEKLGGLPITALRPKHAHAFIRWHKAKNPRITNASINRDLTILKHLLSYAKEVGIIRRNPLQDFKQLPETRRERPRATEEQIDHFLSFFPEPLRAVLSFIRETGCRLGEGLTVKHEQIRCQQGIVVFTENTKSGRFRFVPLTTAALAIVRTIPPCPGCEFVFRNPLTGTRYKNIYRWWRRARKLSGLQWLQPKDLRRQFGIKLSEGGAEMHVIQAVLGHSSVATTERYYAHFSPESAAKRALAVLENCGRKTGGTGKQVELSCMNDRKQECA